MSLIESFVKNPVKVCVAVILVALFGWLALNRMPMQLTPEVEIPTLTVETRWPGASPQEIESEIKKKVLSLSRLHCRNSGYVDNIIHRTAA